MVYKNVMVKSALLLMTVWRTSAASNQTCKCTPSDACWPSPSVWSTLNETVSGRLVPTTLPASVCTTNGTSSHTYFVNATEAQHVQAALLFAGEHNLKISVNNTGHAGANTQRSSACGSLFIQTHSLKGLEFHESYTPESCPSNITHMAATLGAGAQDDDVYQALAEYNAVTVGGTYDTVGIVGWATSGGHGWLTSSYGQGADNIYELEVVTPTGTILTANECQNSDLFWAMRGGGGGTFGVITKITMKAYPMPQTTIWQWNIVSLNSTSAKQWWKLVAELHVPLVELNNNGWQGYYTMTGPAKGPWTLGGFFLAYDKGNATLEADMSAFKTKLEESKALAEPNFFAVERHSAWIEAYNGLPKQGADNNDGPGGVVSITRLLGREDLTGDVDAVARMFEGIGPQADEFDLGVTSHIMAGSMIASPVSVDDALNPAWRKTAVHMIVKGSWSKDLPSAIEHQIQEYMTTRVGGAMRKLSPESGCYVNECDQYEPNWQYAMYGPNYARLRAIKAKYDPKELLWCRRCVGSDEWEYNSGTGHLCPRSLSVSWPEFSLAELV